MSSQPPTPADNSRRVPGSSDATVSEPLPPPHTSATPCYPGPPKAGARPDIPGYEVFEVLGEGGMSVVYKARQISADRIVAIKMIAGEIGSHGDPTRFFREARAIASLQHANIVQIFEVGAWGGQDGRPAVPFFSLEYCAGGSLNRKLAGVPLPSREAAAVVETLARAVYAAHQANVIHRDLKPANVLLTADGTLKVTDFGLAKKLGEQGQTSTGAVMGTPSYMAPEQARGSKDVGTPVDVYGLGAILYECLTGRPPFRSASTVDTVLQVLEMEPLAPRFLNPSVDRDLETISLKCLEKEPQRRPATALALAEELRRFLDGKPIHSRPVGRGERLARWGRRNPLLAAASSLAAAALLAVLVLALTIAVRERRHGNDLRAALQTARYQLAENYLDRALLESSDVEPDERLLWLARALQAAPASSDDLQHAIRLNLAAWRQDLHSLRAVLPHDDVVRCIAFAPGGRQVLTGCADGGVRFHDARSGERVGEPVKHSHPVLAVGFDGQGRGVALLAADAEAVLVDARTGKRVAGPFRHEEAVVAAAFSRDGRLLITGSADHTARVWDLPAGRPLGPVLRHDAGVTAVTLSPDDQSALTGTIDGVAQRWSVATGAPVGLPITHPQLIAAVAFSRDGRRFATGCGDNSARIYDVRTGKIVGAPLRHPPGDGTVWSVTFHPAGDRLLTTGSDGTARLWDLESRESVGQSLDHQDEIRAAAFSDDGRFVATGGYDRVARCWELAPRPFVGPLEHDDEVLAGAFSPDGKRVVTVGDDGTARLWFTATGRPALAPVVHPHHVRAVAFAPDGRSFLTGCTDGTARRWSASTGEMLRSYPHGGPILDVAFSADGQQAATAGSDRNAVLWQTGTGRRVHTLPHEGDVYTAIFSAAGDRLLTGSADGKARLWDTQSGVLKATFAHGGGVWAAIFHPDNERIITGSDDRQGRVWSVNEPTRPDWVLPHQQAVRSVACSGDGQRIATASHDRTARVWDAGTGEPLTRPLRHPQGVIHVVFQPEGGLLASAGVDGTARLWDPRLGRPIGPPLAHRDVVMMIAFDPVGRTLLSCGKDGNARLWPIPAPLSADAERIILWTETLTGKTLDAGGAVRFLEPAAWQQRRRAWQDGGGQRP